MCFVVFCGCFVFCDVFAGVLRVFCEFLQYFTKHTHFKKTSENTEKLLIFIFIKEKHKKLTATAIRSCIAGVFHEQKIATVLHKTHFTKHLKNTANHRKTLAKQSQNAFCEITSQNTAKRSQKR